jgi:hypothetical protein
VGHKLGRLGPLSSRGGLLVGQTHLSGTTMSLVGGDPGIPMSHTYQRKVLGRTMPRRIRLRLSTSR